MADPLAVFREKYPQYNDIPDVQLTEAILKKYPVYKDHFATPGATSTVTASPETIPSGYGVSGSWKDRRSKPFGVSGSWDEPPAAPQLAAAQPAPLSPPAALAATISKPFGVSGSWDAPTPEPYRGRGTSGGWPIQKDTSLPPIPESVDRGYLTAISREVVQQHFPGKRYNDIIRNPVLFDEFQEIVRQRFWSRNPKSAVTFFGPIQR